MPETVTVYFDYLCPFAWRGAEVVEIVSQALELEFVWHHFSLYQSNYQGSQPWQLWNDRIDPDDEGGCKGLLPFIASCAAKCQGPESHQAFRLAALRARHQECRSFHLGTILELAETVGLHMPRFERDLKNPEFRTLLSQEHHQASSLNVFGTPTFQFASGQLAYFRLAKLPPDPSEAVKLFEDFRQLLETYPYLETVKRPRVKRN
jgi:predicted DsbA family dithiol-disulfide isomerase